MKQNPHDRRYWAKAYRKTLSEHTKAAGRHLYTLGVTAAVDGGVITYSAASASLRAAGLGFGHPRCIGDALDGLAGVCGALDTPDLSSVFQSKSSMKASHRWASDDEKEEERQECYDMASWDWPDLTGLLQATGSG